MKTLVLKKTLVVLAWILGMFAFVVFCSSCTRTPLPKQDPKLRAYHNEVKARRAKLKRGWYTQVDNVKPDTSYNRLTGMPFTYGL